MTLIDLVGTTGKANLCTAPSLLGVDIENVPKSKQDEIQGDLFDLPELIIQKSDCIESWIRNVEVVNLWAKGQQYNLHDVNWFKMPNGDLVCSLKKEKIVLKAQDELGETLINGKKMKMQEALDLVYLYLAEKHADEKYIWDLKIVKKYGKSPASEKQKQIIKRFFKNYDTSELTKMEAQQILNKLFYKGA